jgi:aspartyl-tRNA(Asn)/glutamyl-tRNA(Gln) amidotransferase subunit B
VDWSRFFEETLAAGAGPGAAANWMTQDLAGLLNEGHLELAESRITPQHVADLVRLVADGTISSKGAKEAMADAFESGKPIEEIVDSKGLRQVSDASALEPLIDETIAENPQQVEQFRAGKQSLIGFFVGQVMKKTGNSADPTLTQQLLRERLSGS